MSLLKVHDGRLMFWIPEGNVNVAFSSRLGGRSTGPFRSLNLGEHTEDSVENIHENRRRISEALGISSRWLTVKQVHGSRAVQDADLGGHREDSLPPQKADAIVAGSSGPPVAVATADCLPIALKGESLRGVVHAGWRGLCAGVINETLALAGPQNSKVRAYIGPSIGLCHFTVGPEVAEAFRRRYCDAPSFEEEIDGQRHFDLRAAARWVLRQLAVHVDEEDPPCTFCDPELFSHRRDGISGRQAVVVW